MGAKERKNKGKPIIVRVSGVFTTGTLFVPDSEKQVVARVLDIPSVCPRTGQNGENDRLGTNFQHSFCFVRMIHLSPGCRKGQFGDNIVPFLTHRCPPPDHTKKRQPCWVVFSKNILKTDRQKAFPVL